MELLAVAGHRLQETHRRSREGRPGRQNGVERDAVMTRFLHLSVHPTAPLAPARLPPDPTSQSRMDDDPPRRLNLHGVPHAPSHTRNAFGTPRVPRRVTPHAAANPFAGPEEAAA